MYLTRLLLVLAWLGLLPAARAQATGPALLQLARQQEAAGQLSAAADTYSRAATRLQAAGDKSAAAAAFNKSALLSERYAEQLLAGPAARPAAPARLAPPAVARPATPVATAAPAPAVRAAAPVPAAGPAPLPGSTAGGRPVGLFFFMSVFNEERLYYFTPAGQVVANPANFSAGALAAVDPKWRGSFGVSGKEMTVRWVDGRTETHPFRYDQTGFNWDGSFVAVAPFASGRQLVGSFEGHNAAVQVDANSLAVYRNLVFKADGTFTRNSLAASHSQTTAGFTTDAASTAAQVGRWSLSGWYLTLTDAHGTLRGIAFPTSTVDDTPTGTAYYFRFNGTTYRNLATR